jgi:hypothetical protein
VRSIRVNSTRGRITGFCRFVSSGGPYRIEELTDLELEALAVAGQRLCRQENLRGGRTGLAGAALHVGDVGGDLLGALRCLLHVAGNFLRRRTLLSLMDEVISSVAEATDCTLVEASSDAAATMVVNSCERTAVDVNVPAEASNSLDEADTVSTISPTALSKSSKACRH